MKSFTINQNASVYVYSAPVNMCCSFPKLTELAEKQKAVTNKTGHLFLFANKKMNYVKVLWYAKGGWCIFAKQLPAGRFQIPSENKIPLSTLIQLVDFIVTDNKRRQILRKAA